MYEACVSHVHVRLLSFPDNKSHTTSVATFLHSDEEIVFTDAMEAVHTGSIHFLDQSFAEMKD